MQIKDQIRARREQLGMSLAEVAREVGLTEQSLRHWEAGRSNPTKRNAPKLESVLKFQIDWTEGRTVSGPPASSLLNQADIELLLKLTRLPVSVKLLFDRLADEYLAGHGGSAFVHRGEAPSAIQPFVQRTALGKLTDGTNTNRRSAQPRKAQK